MSLVPSARFDGSGFPGMGGQTAAHEELHFKLGCLSHMTYGESSTPPYRVETAHYDRMLAQVGRPKRGSRHAACTCGRCGMELVLRVASRPTVIHKRMANLLLAASLIVFIVIEYSGPTGQISEGRALLLIAAFVSIFVALGSLFRAFFCTDAELGAKIIEDPGNHVVFAAR